MKKIVKKIGLILTVFIFTPVIGDLSAQNALAFIYSFIEHNFGKDKSIKEKKNINTSRQQGQGGHYNDSLLKHYAIIKSCLIKIEEDPKDEQRVKAKRALFHLKKAEIAFARIKGSIDDENGTVTYRSDIKKQHKIAAKQATLLYDELKITDPNADKVKEYAGSFNRAIEIAEKEFIQSKKKVVN